jgi:DNA-binding response OmpR family regulator
MRANVAIKQVSPMSRNAPLRDVIIADNDYMIRDVLRSVLESQAFSVLQAANGIEAIDYAARTIARLVILDYKMPKLDGFAACTQIRRLPGYAAVPIVILTAFNNEATRIAATHAGATMFLTKPFTAVDLLQAITTLFGSRQDDGGSALPAAEPAPFVWERRDEPAPLDDEPAELSEGRRILGICRH